MKLQKYNLKIFFFLGKFCILLDENNFVFLLLNLPYVQSYWKNSRKNIVKSEKGH